MKILVICRPRPDLTAAELRPHLTVEMETLRQLRASGQLHEAFSPGGPGAVLIMDCQDIGAARRITETLPLYRAGLIETEFMELHPFDLQ